MNNRPSRKEVIRLLRLAEAGKLTAADLVEQSPAITLDLSDNAWLRTDGTRMTIDDKQRECRARGAMFVTLDLS